MTENAWTAQMCAFFLSPALHPMERFPGSLLGDLACNPNHVYSEVSPTVLNGSYSLESVFRISALGRQRGSSFQEFLWRGRMRCFAVAAALSRLGCLCFCSLPA